MHTAILASNQIFKQVTVLSFSFFVLSTGLLRRNKENYFANNVFSTVSMSASQFKAKPDRSARFCRAIPSIGVNAQYLFFCLLA